MSAKADTRWEDIEGGVTDRHDGKGNLAIAMGLYNAGGGTVASLSEDWELSDAERDEFMRVVKAAWSGGRWADRRRTPTRREGD